MWKHSRRPSGKIGAAAIAVTALALSGVMPAFADADTGVGISGGALSGGAVGFSPFSGITLGTNDTATASWSIGGVTDARGNGAGWNVSLTLTQLKEYDAGAYVQGGKTLPTSSIAVTVPPFVSLAGDSGSSPDTVAPVAAGTALDTGSAVKLLSAAPGGGMGSYSFSDMIVTLTVPANAYARNYKTDATVSLNATP